MIDAYGACSVLSFARVCLVSIPEKWSHFKMKMSAMYFSRLLALRVKFFVGKLSTSIIWTWVEGSISSIAILCNDKSWWKFPGSAGRHTCEIRNSALEMRNLGNHLNLESNTVLDSLIWGNSDLVPRVLSCFQQQEMIQCKVGLPILSLSYLYQKHPPGQSPTQSLCSIWKRQFSYFITGVLFRLLTHVRRCHVSIHL